MSDTIQTSFDKTKRGYISKYDRFKVLKRQEWRCLCGKRLKFSSKQDYGCDTAHIDHIKPLSKGGVDSIENYQALCPDCNLHKSAKIPVKFKSGGMSISEIHAEIAKIDGYIKDACNRTNIHVLEIINHLQDTKSKLMLYTKYKGRI